MTPQELATLLWYATVYASARNTAAGYEVRPIVEAHAHEVMSRSERKNLVRIIGHNATLLTSDDERDAWLATAERLET